MAEVHIRCLLLLAFLIFSEEIQASLDHSQTINADHLAHYANKAKWTRENDHRLKRQQHRYRFHDDISLWINSKQILMLSGYSMEIFIIMEGQVKPYLFHKNFENQLPVIPAEVNSVDFTWKSGSHPYLYDFNILKSLNNKIMSDPILSIRPQGKVPMNAKNFNIELKCLENAHGTAKFVLQLRLKRINGLKLPHTPLRVTLKKSCRKSMFNVSKDCEERGCENDGVCDELSKRCQCQPGFLGSHCQTSLCYPQCYNGGTCSAPGKCLCLKGYHGRSCEGGICRKKCLNGGKCIQKDTCRCRKGFFGNRCQYSHCNVLCVNGGRCNGINKCKCKKGFSGDHCQVEDGVYFARKATRCKKRCVHGLCSKRGKCSCQEGYRGRMCRKRKRNRNI